MEKSNRYKSFWSSEAPLTSKRGRLVISNPVQSEILIKAVRYSRLTNNSKLKSSTINFSKSIVEQIKAL